MEEFIENIKMLTSTLGHKIFDDKREIEPKKNTDVFSIKAARGADAQGIFTSEGFVVFKGSKAAATLVPSITQNFVKFRQKLIDQGSVIQQEEYLEFPEDYIFSSPSTAAAIVMGRNANGLTEWKQPNGRTLKDFESNE